MVYALGRWLSYVTAGLAVGDLEYEQAIAIGGIGECLAATASKNWGDGPQGVAA